MMNEVEKLTHGPDWCQNPLFNPVRNATDNGDAMHRIYASRCEVARGRLGSADGEGVNRVGQGDQTTTTSWSKQQTV